MTTLFYDFMKILALERLDENLYQGNSLDIGGVSVFGGQVVSQALVAAAMTVTGRSAHSLHGYFLRPGDMKQPILYAVERIREGRSFATRSIVATQKGRTIFTMAASFQTDEHGFDHQSLMPKVPDPDDLPSINEFRKNLTELDPEVYQIRPVRDLPIEIKPIQPLNPYSNEAQPRFQKLWFRSLEKLSDDNVLHQCILAYASDLGLLRTAILPHEITFRHKNIQAASIDHAIWFHRNFRADQWLLYVMESPSASGARGIAIGSIFTRDGLLVATVVQEGLMRMRTT